MIIARLSIYRIPFAGDVVLLRLVDRLWPRGVKKTDAAIDRWLREIAPSAAARTGKVTLVYRARDEAHYDAVVLKELLTDDWTAVERRRRSSGGAHGGCKPVR